MSPILFVFFFIKDIVNCINTNAEDTISVDDIVLFKLLYADDAVILLNQQSPFKICLMVFKPTVISGISPLIQVRQKSWYLKGGGIHILRFT